VVEEGWKLKMTCERLRL